MTKSLEDPMFDEGQSTMASWQLGSANSRSKITILVASRRLNVQVEGISNSTLSASCGPVTLIS